MDVDAIRNIAKKIRHSTSFSMETTSECGRPQCIEGWCQIELYKEIREITSMTGFAISKLFEVSDELVRLLYAPNNNHAHWSDRQGSNKHITKEHAASMLYYLADTGEVDWSVKEYFPIEAKIEEERILVKVKNNDNSHSYSS